MQPPLPNVSKLAMIRDVWADNLEAEFRVIRELVLMYPYVAMDTEFPGVVAKPVGSFRTTHEFYYQSVRCNVNLLKIIQLGITLMNERGEVPDKCCTWQFNFRFSLTEDIYAQDSIDLLKNGGLNFDYFATHGIDVGHFAELLTSSGLVLCEDVRWLSFHSGYDFGYLVRALHGRDLPEKEEDFAQIFHIYFPSVFDIKYMLRLTDMGTQSIGLDPLADMLGVRRIGTAHQAGSDSLLSGHIFFKFVRERFGGTIPLAANGVLYGLADDIASNSTPAMVSAPAQNSRDNGNRDGASGTGSSVAGGVRDSPSQYTGPTPAAGSFPSTPVAGSQQYPSTPLMAMVMHGGSSTAKVHASKS